MAKNKTINSKPIEFDGFNYGGFAIIKRVEFYPFGNFNYTEIGVIKGYDFCTFKNQYHG